MASCVVRCRTVNNIRLRITVDDDGVYLTTLRDNGKSFSYPPMPAKRWWNEYITMVHPSERDALHQFLGLS